MAHFRSWTYTDATKANDRHPGSHEFPADHPEFEAYPDNVQPRRGLEQPSCRTFNQPRRVLEMLAFVLFLSAIMEVPALVNTQAMQAAKTISKLQLQCPLIRTLNDQAGSGTMMTQRCYWSTKP